VAVEVSEEEADSVVDSAEADLAEAAPQVAGRLFASSSSNPNSNSNSNPNSNSNSNSNSS
jgi:hypothetical protein